MAKTLQLVFNTESGKRVTISIDEPVENISEEMVQTAAANVIASNIFSVEGEQLQQIVSAKVTERHVTDILQMK